MPSVLFVCTGNICRSPMAAALFKRLIRPERSKEPWRVESAGTWAVKGLPPSQHGQTVMKNRGLDTSEHRSRPIDTINLESFDLILTMEAGHKEALQVEFPALADRVYMLSEMIGETMDIADPIGGPIEAYDETADELDSLLKGGFRKIIHLAERRD